MEKEEKMMVAIISILSVALAIGIVGTIVYMYKYINTIKMERKGKIVVITMIVLLGVLGSGLIVAVIIYVKKITAEKDLKKIL